MEDQLELRQKFRAARKLSRSLGDLKAGATPPLQVINDPALQVTGFSPVVPAIDARAPATNVEEVLPTAPQHREVESLRKPAATAAPAVPQRRGHTRHTSLCDTSQVLNERLLPRPLPRGGMRPTAAPAPPPRSPTAPRSPRGASPAPQAETVPASAEETPATLSEPQTPLGSEAAAEKEAEAPPPRVAAKPMLSAEQRSTSQPALKRNIQRPHPQRASGTQTTSRLHQSARRATPTSPSLGTAQAASQTDAARRLGPLLSEKLQKFLDAHSNLAKATQAQAKLLSDYSERRLATRPKDEIVLRCAATTSTLVQSVSDEIAGMCSSASEDMKRNQAERRQDLRAFADILDTMRALHHMYSNATGTCEATLPAMLEFRSRVSASELSDMDEVGDEVEDGTDIVKKGHLWKKGVSRRNWKYRFFVLKPRVLYYFNNEKDQKLLGTVSLVNCTVGAVNIRRPHCFAISAKDRIFQMSAADDKERGEWMGAIMKCIELDMGGDPAKLAHISRQHSATMAEKRPTPAAPPPVGSLLVGFAGATTVTERKVPSPGTQKLHMKSASSDILRAMVKNAEPTTEKAAMQRTQTQQKALNRTMPGTRAKPPPRRGPLTASEGTKPMEKEEEEREKEEKEEEEEIAAAEAKLEEINKRYSVQYVWMRNSE